MDDILSPEALLKRIRNKAYIAYIKGEDHNSHGMNPGSPQIADFQAEHDRLVLVYGSNTHQHTGPRRRFSDKRQGGA